MFDAGQSERKILIPILAPPVEGSARFEVELTDVRGVGKLSKNVKTEVTLEAFESKI